MILSMFPISSRETSGLFLFKIVLNFICGNSTKISSLVGEESVRIEFFEERIERELDLVRQCVVGKQGSVFFSKVRNVSPNIFNVIPQHLVSFKQRILAN